MKIYLKQNVFDAALDRIRLLFDEFPNVIVNISGGKDSTVVLNLALIVAEEKKRLPLNVLFIDQEAEWQTVIDHIRVVMADPQIKPYWLQVPIKIFNATSTLEPWLQCWEDGKEWMREKELGSIHENKYGTDRFAQMFDGFIANMFPDQKACYLAGVRTEETPMRFLGLTGHNTYNGITWGKIINRKVGHYSFYPIYDWSYTDVWKSIHDNKWSYCKIYDYMYQQGVQINKMRVSNLHHETAVHALFYLQEIEGETWSKLTKRLSGINSVTHIGNEFLCPHDLPFMFETWRDYRDYLLENLISDKQNKDDLAKMFASDDGKYDDNALVDLVRKQISIIMTNDFHGTKMGSFHSSHLNNRKNRIASSTDFHGRGYD
jgi:predicted phosphoadenosine phosphosulfate sulfurtransferase